MRQIHPTALVDTRAELAADVVIGPYCVVEAGCRIGEGTRLWQGVYVASGTEIGSQCTIHMGAVLGHEPQHLQWEPGTESGLRIGDRNVIREYVTIHRGYRPGSCTVLGDDNYLMGLSHVGHDCVIGNRVVIANSALLSGHVTVEDNVFISGNTGIHQFVRIGRLAMVGGLARVSKDIVPYVTVVGDNEVVGLNTEGLRRAGLTAAQRTVVRRAYRILFQSGLNTAQALRELELLLPEPLIEHLIGFIRSAQRGIAKPRSSQ